MSKLSVLEMVQHAFTSQDAFKAAMATPLFESMTINDFLAIVGLIVIAFCVLKTTFNVSAKFMNKLTRKSIKSYGDWAIVTGGSEGIGLGYALSLAKEGLNIVLIARNKEKLVAAKKTIEGKYPNITVLTLSADLASGDLEVFQDIKDFLCKHKVLKNVGVLVNNAGVSYPGALFFHELDEYAPGLRSSMININVTALTEMTALVLPYMVEKRNGAIINIASAAGRVPIGNPYYAEYSATKAYVDYFSRALHHEMKAHNVHVQCHSPYFVATAMSRIKNGSFFIPTANQFAAAAVADIGSSDTSVPYFSHKIQDLIIQSLPKWLLSMYLRSSHADFRRRYFKKLEREAKKGK